MVEARLQAAVDQATAEPGDEGLLWLDVPSPDP